MALDHEVVASYLKLYKDGEVEHIKRCLASSLSDTAFHSRKYPLDKTKPTIEPPTLAF